MSLLDKEYEKWTITHAQYLQMGGYWLQCLPDERKHIPSKYGRTLPAVFRGKEQMVWELPLSFDTMKSAFNEGYISLPFISQDEILDKSEKDGLSRGVTMIQLMWFIVQISVRKRQNLAITAIELATATLAGLNISMYMTWSSKPMDILVPTIIMSKALARHVSSLSTSANSNDTSSPGTSYKGAQGTEPPRDTSSPSQGDTEFSEEEIHKVGDKEKVNFATELTKVLRESWATVSSFPKTFVAWIVEFISKLLKQARCISLPVLKLSCVQHSPSISSPPPTLTSKFRTTISQIWSTITYPFLALFYYPIQAILDSGKNLHSTGVGREVEEIEHMRTSKLVFGETRLRLAMNMVFFCEDVANAPSICLSALSVAIFGMIHCLAWNFAFPSHIERLLWRTSSAVITGLCILIVIGFLVNSIINTFHPRWKVPSPHSAFITRITGLVCKICAFLFVFSRLSLLMLSVAQLRDLPTSAFDTVKWLDIFPHV